MFLKKLHVYGLGTVFKVFSGNLCVFNQNNVLLTLQFFVTIKYKDDENHN